MTEGDMLPEATVLDEHGRAMPLSELVGVPVVLYFYPRDDTAGCTQEAKDFSALLVDFAASNVRVIGVSRDTITTHRRFADKYALTVTLVSDPEAEAAQAFGIWGERSLYGRRYMGVERATFLFGADGRLRRSWRKVRVAGHAAAVLAAARDEGFAGD